MSKEPDNIPQKDLDLAREIGENLESGRTISQMNDPLVNSILEFRRNETYVIIPELISLKKECWEKIETAVEGEERPIDSDRQKRIIPFVLKAAAGFLLVALTSLILFNVIQRDNAELIASTENEITQIELREGEQVDIRPRSELYSLEQSDLISRYRLEGEAFFRVTKDPDRNFIVEAGSASIVVTGTSFNVQSWSDSTIVYLEEGSLRVRSQNSNEIEDLNAGFYVVVTDESGISVPREATGERFTAWRQNEIYLEKRAVSSVLDEMEHHFGVIIKAPETLQSDTLGGSVSLLNAENSLQSLGVVLGGKFIETEKGVYEFEQSTPDE